MTEEEAREMGYDDKPVYFENEDGLPMCRLMGYEFEDKPDRGPSRSLDAESFVMAIRGSRGVLANVARQLGISRPPVYDWLRHPENEDMRQLLHQERESHLDDLEETLFDLALGGREKSLHFALKSIGWSRGYGFERVDQRVQTIGPGEIKEMTTEEAGQFIKAAMAEYEQIQAASQETAEVVEGEYEENERQF